MLKRENVSFSGIIYALALLVLAYQLGSGLVEYGQHALAALDFPYPLDYGEGPILDQVLRLARFENIYRDDLAIPPYNVSNYPPIFHLVQLPFVWLFGPAFWYGRLLSLLSAIVTAAAIALMVHYLTGEWIAALASGLLLFAFPYILQWSVFDRVDTLALALSWIGLTAIVRWSHQKKGLILAIFLITAAIYTKQSYGLAVPLTAVIWLIAKRRLWQALWFALGLISACLVIFFAVNRITTGGFFLNIVTANVNDFSHVTLMEHVTNFFTHGWLLLFFAVGFLIIERWWYPTRSWPLVLPYFVTTSLTLFLSGKEGSSNNYMYEVAAALCLAAGAVLAWPRRNFWMKAVLILLLAFQVNWLVSWSRDEFVPFVMAKVRSTTEVARMAAIIKDAPSPVLSDEYMGLSPLAGRSIYFQPFEFSQLQKAGLWDPARLVSAIQRREFSFLLLYEPTFGSPMIVSRWSPQIRNAMWDNYEMQSMLAGTWIYRPKQ